MTIEIIRDALAWCTLLNYSRHNTSSPHFN
jgi:hypothetical protein